MTIQDYRSYLEREFMEIQQLQQDIANKDKEIHNALSGIYNHQYEVLHRWFLNQAHFHYGDLLRQEADHYRQEQESKISKMWTDKVHLEDEKKRLEEWLQHNKDQYTHYHKLVQDKQRHEYLLKKLEREPFNHHNETVKASQHWLMLHKQYEPWVHIPLDILKAMRERSNFSRWWNQKKMTAIEKSVHAMSSDNYLELYAMIEANAWQHHRDSVFVHQKMVEQHQKAVKNTSMALSETLQLIQSFEKKHAVGMEENQRKVVQLRTIDKRIHQIEQENDRWNNEQEYLESKILEQWFDRCYHHTIDDSLHHLYNDYINYKDIIRLRSEQCTRELESHREHWHDVGVRLTTIEATLLSQLTVLKEYSETMLKANVYPLGELWRKALQPLLEYIYAVDVTHALTSDISLPDFPLIPPLLLPRYEIINNDSFVPPPCHV